MLKQKFYEKVITVQETEGLLHAEPLATYLCAIPGEGT
jgi:hypothetical protein